jgi:hypothetical protein
MLEVAAKKGFWLKVLGQVAGPDRKYEIWLLRTRDTYSYDHKDPRCLIVGGTHGEEIAGPWAILKWLQTCDDKWLRQVDVSFIPIVNPYGFARKKRYGYSDIPTNQGFCHTDDKLSPEAQILYDNIELLRPLAHDGFLSLHEDVTVKEYYLYTFEQGQEPGKFTKAMKKELSKHFLKPYDGVAYSGPNTTEGPRCEDGLVYKFCDGSFEDLLFHKGVPKVAVTETPGKYRLDRRVKAGQGIIQRFVEVIYEY